MPRPPRALLRAAASAFAAAAAIVVAAAPVAAQSHSPSSDVDGRRLGAGIDSLSVYIVSGTDTIPAGSAVHDVRVVALPGGPVLRRTFHSNDRVLGEVSDTLLLDAATLAPLRQRGRTVMAAVSLDYVEGLVRGSMHLALGGETPIVHVLPHGTLSGSGVDLVLRAANLHADWRGEFSVFLAPPGEVAVLRAAVTGTEEVGGEATWRVEADFAGLLVTFWIGAETRTLHRQTLPLTGDAVLIYERVGGTG